MDFTKLVCPVCGKRFTDDDDIVVCPVCGTPHHRECYNKNGECINADIHDKGYVYQNNDKTIVEENYKDIKDEEYENGPIDETDEQARQRKEIERLEKIASDINYYDKKDVKIDGKPSIIYEKALGKKADYYIPRFLFIERLGKKVIFNFAAFLCPLAWAAYRRIYKLVAAILAFYVLVFSVLYIPVALNSDLNAAMNTLYEEEGTRGMIKAYSYSSSDNGELTVAESNFLKAIENASPPEALLVAVRISGYIMRIALSLFGTYIYFCTTKKRINKICETNTDIASADMLAMKECRTSFGFAVVALFIDILFFI